MTNKSVDELLEAAKASNDPTVKQALHKLLFVTSLAHDKDYIERASMYHFHSGCTVTIPRSDYTTLSIVWNDEDVAIHTTDYQYVQFRYGNLINENTPLPGVVLIEDRNYKT